MENNEISLKFLFPPGKTGKCKKSLIIYIGKGVGNQTLLSLIHC